MIGHHLIPRYMEENRVMGLFCWWDDPQRKDASIHKSMSA